MSANRVAVIGAGLAGLVTIKSCLEEGLEVTCFEKTAAIGGNWQFKEDDVSVFRNTELTSSKYITAFSDFQMPEDFPYFIKHTQYFQYLCDYATRFGLNKHITFNSIIKSADRREGKWRVTIDGPEGKYEEVFDYLAVCTGLNGIPNIPDFPGMDKFKGEIVHSGHYKDAEPFRDKRVVVIGGGESGGDILAELASVAKELTMSLRRGPFIMYKLDEETSIPADSFHCRATYHMPPCIYAPLEMVFQNVLTFIKRGQRPYEIRQQLIDKSGGSYHQQYLVKSDKFIQTLAKEGVQLCEGVESFTQEGVCFTDGNKAVADVAIICSGFKIDFPFLPVDTSQWDWRDLYKKVVHPDLERVGFIGFARPDIGAQPPVVELQARYFAALASGRKKLPASDEMARIIEEDRAETTHLKPVVCERVTGIVPIVPYMYELADLVGCRPQLRKLLLKPRVLWAVLFGTFAGPHFRLHGPNADPNAEAIIKQEGAHLFKLKKPVEMLSFGGTQVIWGLGSLLVYPIAKLLSSVFGIRSMRPKIDY